MGGRVVSEQERTATGRSAEVWRIEYMIGCHAGGRWETEYVEGDDQAESRIMELDCDRLADAGRAGGLSTASRRTRAWLVRRPTKIEKQSYQNVMHLKAFRLVDGEWIEACWALIPPTIEVIVAGRNNGSTPQEPVR